MVDDDKFTLGSDGRTSSDLNEKIAQADDFFSRGNFTDALVAYKNIDQYHAPNHFILERIAFIENRSGNLKSATSYLLRSLPISTNKFGVAWSLCELFFKLSNYANALKFCDYAISFNPTIPGIYSKKSHILFIQKKFEYSLEVINIEIDKHHDYPFAYYFRSLTLMALGRLQESLESLDTAIALKADFSLAYSERGVVLLSMARTQDAILSANRSIEIYSNNPAQYSQRGYIKLCMKKFDEAILDFDKAISLNPDAHNAKLMRSEALLLKGDYAQGWSFYDARWKTKFRKSRDIYKDIKKLNVNENLINKKVLILPEVGFGDYIMFVRYSHLLKDMGAKIVFSAPKPLRALFSALGEDVDVIEDGKPLPDVDYQCPIMDFPSVFKTRIDTVPAQFPYLIVPDAKQQQWHQKIGQSSRPKIGLMWSGDPRRAIERNMLRRRSFPIDSIAKLFSVDVEFHSLQKETSEHDLKFLSQYNTIVQHQDALTDFLETAALINEMDLVISIDTSVAHLAGALGKPLWVLLPYYTDYRWTADAETTPWYPSARLFRQARPGDFAGVMDQVVQCLKGYRF